MSTPYEPGDILPNDVAANLIDTPDKAPAISVENVQEEAKAPKFVPGGMLQPFKVRNFSLLFGGQTISTVGDALYAVALPWLILNNGGNAQELGFVLTAYAIPRMGSVLLGGWLSDRLRPRRIMLIADTIRAVLVALLAMLALRGGLPNLWALCTIAVPLGAFAGLFLPASTAILPDILDDEHLQAGNALSFSSSEGANLIGSAVAGVIVAVLTSGAALVMDALSFVISAVSLAMIRVANITRPHQREETADEASTLATEGATQPQSIALGDFLRTSRLLHVAFLVAIIANFCFSGLLEVTLPTLVHGLMNGGSGGYGAMLAGFGAGALAGGIFAGMLGKVPRKGLIALLIGMIQGLTVAFLPYGNVTSAIVLMVIFGLSNSISNVTLVTLLQLYIPRHLLGRVLGLMMFATYGSAPISFILAGVLTTRFGPVILFPFGGAALILAILFGISQRELREL